MELVPLRKLSDRPDRNFKRQETHDRTSCADPIASVSDRSRVACYRNLRSLRLLIERLR